MDYKFAYFYLFLILGWIPILALKVLICGVINAINDARCKHEFEYDETNLLTKYDNVPTNISVSATCKKCGYHKKYLKYKK